MVLPSASDLTSKGHPSISLLTAGSSILLPINLFALKTVLIAFLRACLEAGSPRNLYSSLNATHDGVFF